jgi:hypothetical protein
LGKRWEGRRAADDAFAYMDAREAESWARRTVANDLAREEASKRYPPINVADTVSDLMRTAGNNVETVMDVLRAWNTSRSEHYGSYGHEDRASNVVGTY